MGRCPSTPDQCNELIGQMGDTVSFTCVLSEDAKQEVSKLLSSKSYYIGMGGRMAFSASTDIVNLVLANMTG